VVALCGHFYCKKCFLEQLALSNQCCVCQVVTGIRDFAPSRLMEQAVAQQVDSLDEDGRRNFELRRASHAAWMEQKKVPLIKKGRKVDLLDDDGVWKDGSILAKRRIGKHRLEVLVGVDGLGPLGQRYLKSNSIRLASPRFMADFQMQVPARDGFHSFSGDRAAYVQSVSHDWCHLRAMGQQGWTPGAPQG